MKQAGAVVARQRFGGIANLNPDLHVLVPDGLFVPGGDDAGTLSFAPLPPPDDEEIRRLVVRLATRLTAIGHCCGSAGCRAGAGAAGVGLHVLHQHR